MSVCIRVARYVVPLARLHPNKRDKTTGLALISCQGPPLHALIKKIRLNTCKSAALVAESGPKSAVLKIAISIDIALNA